MTIIQKLLNLDEVFSKLSTEPIIINYLPNNTIALKEYAKKILTTQYTSDTLSVLPRCICGSLKGEYLLGSICKQCNTKVNIERDAGAEPLIWYKAPEGIAPIISPIVLCMLRKRFLKKGFDVMTYLTDTHYQPQISTKAYYIVSNLNLPRGHNNFFNNFDNIIDTLRNLKIYQKQKSNLKSDSIIDFIYLHRNIIFSEHIPLPNKTLLIIENTSNGMYIDPLIVDVIDVLEILIGIESGEKKYSIKSLELRTSKIINMLSNYYESFFRKRLSKKTGILRQHIFGYNAHFSFRGVITSLTDPHVHDEIKISWSMANALLRPHLINKMVKKHNFTPMDALVYLFTHSRKYSNLLESLHKELIDESPYKGIPCILLRNPSLLSGSEQFLRITKIKTDVDDFTIEISELIVKAYNADI